MCHIFKQRGEGSEALLFTFGVRQASERCAISEQERPNYNVVFAVFLTSLSTITAEILCCGAVFSEQHTYAWEILLKPSWDHSSSENKELENVTFDRQRITRCKNCKVPVGRKKAKQCSGRKNSWQLWHLGPIFLLNAHVVLLQV